jgi:hypothetical protein
MIYRVLHWDFEKTILREKQKESIENQQFRC